MYDSQFGNQGVDDIAKYVKLGKLGEAFSSEEQVILLIDEIDKADLEFPNDLLWELDKMEFYIPETKQTIKAKHRPIVIITSNAEKRTTRCFFEKMYISLYCISFSRTYGRNCKCTFPKFRYRNA